MRWRVSSQRTNEARGPLCGHAGNAAGGVLRRNVVRSNSGPWGTRSALLWACEINLSY